MAISKSGIFAGTIARSWDTTIALNLSSETTVKGYLVLSTITPSFSAASGGYATYSASEVTGGSWAAKGATLTTTTLDLTTTAESLIFDAADVSQVTTTLVNAYAIIIFDDNLAGDDNVCLVSFGSAVSTSNGTFEIVWAAPGSGGIYNVDFA